MDGIMLNYFQGLVVVVYHDVPTVDICMELP